MHSQGVTIQVKRKHIKTNHLINITKIIWNIYHHIYFLIRKKMILLSNMHKHSLDKECGSENNTY